MLVSDRSAATLLPLIQEHVLPGSNIVSDQWAAYGGIRQLNVNPPYDRVTVNHQIEFVNAAWDTTNHIEAMSSRYMETYTNKYTEPARR